MAAIWSGNPSIWGPTNTIRMILLTISLAGVQIVWGFELAYCSPYLLSLGLTKSMMSLVWIVGPLSGLVTQPIVGAIADRSRSRWGRRRPFMILGTLVVGSGLLVLGWAADITGAFLPDSPAARTITIILAVLSIYILDFSINAVQASCRALVVDSLPVQQQQLGSAWASRMIAIGNLAGYFVGTLDLKSMFGTVVGDTQIKQLCILSFMTLLTTVGMTSLSVTERVLVTRRVDDNKGLLPVLKTIFTTMFRLPTRIAALCRIWFCAWIGWFPFLLYSTTFVGEVLQRYDNDLRQRLQKSTDVVGDIARVGAMALVVYSCVSLVASFSLPWLVQSPESESLTRNKSGKHGRFDGLLEFLEIYRPDLVTSWAIGHLIFAIAMFTTIFIRSVAFATFVVGCCGIPWALMTWAPFAILGEEINRLANDPSSSATPHSRSRYARLSTDSRRDSHEDHPMMTFPRPSLGSVERPSIPALGDLEADTQSHSGEGDRGSELSGVYLGIMNVAACLPQFVSTFISFIVFSILEPGKSPEFASGGPGGEEGDVSGGGGTSGVNAIAVVLGLGGLAVLLAGHYTIRFKEL